MSMSGKILGTFTLEAQIGKGGMGEVYRAKDQKLGRDVAIKVLPEEFAKDTDRVARFQREAKLLASLNHPNIASIYGLEESDGTHFLVLELIEGDTLADRLKRGAIPVEESLKLALQIAEALEAAHEKGVIHRDLKPANIKVTPDGKVKVLDFGLAKAFAGDSEDINLSNSPTLSAAATQQGVILGTAAYMSPEQARGNPVDKKADIWAFGVVLFEMLTGRPIFSEDTVSDTLASVLKTEPDWRSLPPNLHSRIRFLLERCLEKDPKNRYGGIREAIVEIQKVLADPSGVLSQPSAIAKPRKRVRLGLPWVAAIFILGLISAWLLKPAPTPEAKEAIRFDYELPISQKLNNTNLPAIAVSRDGKRFAYSTTKGIYLRSLDELEARLITGTEDNPQRPFFSPDGKWIGYWSGADSKLKKISINGGAPISLCDATLVASASWSTNDSILYGQLNNKIMQISSNGGNPETLIENKDGNAIYHPRFLPDGKSVIYTLGTPEGYKIAVQSLESAEQKVLFPGDNAYYLPTGHLVYAVQNDLFAIQFDANTLEQIGSPASVNEGVFRIANFSAPQYDVSDTGTLVYMPMTSSSSFTDQSNLVWIYRDGKEEPLKAKSNNFLSQKVSPDGTKVAVTVADSENVDIWIWDLVRENMIKLTMDETIEIFPLWTRDGKRIFFSTPNSGITSGDMSWIAVEGTGEAVKVLSQQGAIMIPGSWSNDGDNLVFMEVLTSGVIDINIGMLAIKDIEKREALLQGEYDEIQPQISPDGRWMAYASNKEGRYEVYVRPFPEVNKFELKVSTSGGNSPLWSPDGKQLFYLSGNSVMAVAVKMEQSLSFGAPQSLFSRSYFNFDPPSFDIRRLNQWDIHPDGKRFLMMKPAAAAKAESTGEETAPVPQQKINVILNWFEELKERVPVD